MISENLLGVIHTWHYIPVIMVGFVLLVIVLNQFLYKPVLKIIDERKHFMHNMKDQAHALREKSESLTQQYQTELTHEKKTAFEELDRKKKEILKKSQEEIQKAKLHADGFVSQELKRAEKSYESAKKELMKEVEVLSAEVIEKISKFHVQTKGEL